MGPLCQPRNTVSSGFLQFIPLYATNQRGRKWKCVYSDKFVKSIYSESDELSGAAFSLILKVKNSGINPSDSLTF